MMLEAQAPPRIVQGLGRWSDIRQVERYSRALKEWGKFAHTYSPLNRLMGLPVIYKKKHNRVRQPLAIKNNWRGKWRSRANVL
jgi:hypothetical protein